MPFQNMLFTSTELTADTAVELFEAATGDMEVLIENSGGGASDVIYIGASGITSSTGFPVRVEAGYVSFQLTRGDKLYGYRPSSSSGALRVFIRSR